MSLASRGAAACLALAVVGCGPKTSFLEQARQTAPAFGARGSSGQPLTGKAQKRQALEQGTVVSSMFQLLRDYEYPRDEGRVDMTNIYKVLHEADNAVTTAAGKCATFSERAVVPPFSLGAAQTYTCAGNDSSQSGYKYGFALKETGTTTHALAAFRWAPDPTQQKALGVMQGQVDSTTHDVSLTMVNLVSYPAGSSMGGANGDGFSLRTTIDGNASTHHFTLRALVTSLSNPDGWTSLVGEGVSRGAGQFFLFKAWRGGPGPAIDGKYFCLTATVDEAGLETVDVNGSATAPSDCASYTPAVDALERLTRAQAPLQVSDFAGGDVDVTWAP